MALTVCITGGNRSIGFETAKQLAEDGEVGKVIITSRSQEKAEAAIASLTGEFGLAAEKFDHVVLDLESKASVLAAVEALPKVDRIVLNAGGYYRGMHEAGVTKTFAATLGHTVLVDGLIAAGKIGKGSRVIYSVTEGLRAVWSFAGVLPSALCGVGCGMFGPSSVEPAITKHSCNFPAFKAGIHEYSKGKLVGHLYFSQMAIEHPDIYFLSVSPGGAATEFGKELDFPLNLVLTKCACLLTLIGNYQPVQKSANRYVVTVTGEEKYPSGNVAMTRKQCGCLPLVISGKMADNTSFQSYFKNAKLKQKAYSTVRDIASKWSSEAPPGAEMSDRGDLAN